jgi:hypothetical protein
MCIFVYLFFYIQYSLQETSPHTGQGYLLTEEEEVDDLWGSSDEWLECCV